MTVILKTGDYTLHAEVTPLERPAGHYSLHFSSQLSTAQDPSAHRTLYQFTGGGESLRKLATEICTKIGDLHVQRIA